MREGRGSAVGEGSGDSGGFACLVHVYHHADSAEGFAVGIQEATGDEEVFGFEGEERTVGDVVAGRDGRVLGVPATPLGRAGFGDELFASVEIAEDGAFGGVDIDGVGALGDGVGEGLAAEDFVACEAVVTAGVPGFADAEGLRPRDDDGVQFGGVRTEQVKVGAVKAAGFEDGVGVCVGVGGVDAVETGAEEVGEGVGAGDGEVPRAAVGDGIVMGGEEGFEVRPGDGAVGCVGAGDDGLEIDGLEDGGFFGGEAGVAEEIAVARGVDVERGGYRAASGAVFDNRGGDARAFAGGGYATGGEEDADAVRAHEVVEFDGEFGAVETELSAVNGGDFPEDSAAAEPFDNLAGESADDLACAGGVVDGVPLVDLRGDGHAAEEGVLLDDGDGEPEAGGADGGEHAGAGTADDAEIGFMADGDGAGGFLEETHDRADVTMRQRGERLKKVGVVESNHVIDKTNDFGVMRVWLR